MLYDYVLNLKAWWFFSWCFLFILPTISDGMAWDLAAFLFILPPADSNQIVC
jgi:hypothetical protein